MANYPLVEGYLASVREQIGLGSSEDLLYELGAHLDESVRKQIANGATTLEAQVTALSLFGEPRGIAKAYHQNAQCWVSKHSRLARVASFLGIVGGVGWIGVAVLTLAIYLHPSGIVGRLGDFVSALTVATCVSTALFLSGVAPARSSRRSNWRVPLVFTCSITAAVLVAVNRQLLVALVLLTAASWLATDGLRWNRIGTVGSIQLIMRWALPLGISPVLFGQLLSASSGSFGFPPNLVENAAVYGSLCLYGAAVVMSSGRLRSRLWLRG